MQSDQLNIVNVSAYKEKHIHESVQGNIQKQSRYRLCVRAVLDMNDQNRYSAVLCLLLNSSFLPYSSHSFTHFTFLMLI